MEQNPTPANARAAERGQQITLLGMAANVVLMLVKAAAGWLGNSYALIADALESATDLVTSLFVWLGLRTAARRPDQNHPYGHGKAEPLAAVLVAAGLWSAAAVIGYQSIQNIVTPHAPPKLFTLYVLGGIIVAKEGLYRLARRVGKQVGSAAVQADAWHHRADAITSGLAFVGICIALWAGPGFESADDWAALAASIIIVYNAWLIFRPALGEIMDEAPAGDWPAALDNIALQVPGVLSTEKALVRKMGFEFFVDIHVRVDGELTVRQGHDIAHAVKAAIQAERPYVYDVLVHVEPAD